MTTASPGTGVRQRLEAPPGRDFWVPATAVVCGALLALGLRLRDEMLWSAERGLGYALGVLGLSCMTLLLGYSARKRRRGLRRLGPLRHWFRIHMMLGIVGPTAILLHANFRMGSWNARVALASMLLVATSGWLGRFVYARIHRGLFGRRRALEDLRWEAQAGFGDVARVLRVAPEVAPEVEAFERWAADPAGGVLARFATARSRARRVRRRGRRALAERAPADRARLERSLDEYLAVACRVARFRGWERLFALWHAVHLPLCLLLFGAATAHVLAVHMY